MDDLTKQAKSKNKFALRLMPSVKLGAERVSASEGVSLNQFINVAIAEKVARVEHQQWAARRMAADTDAQVDALDLLHRGELLEPVAGDEVPEGWPIRRTPTGRAAETRSRRTASAP